MSSLTQHPLSAAFPAMPSADLQALTDDIRAHGLRFPIIILSGMVLDGWHRATACRTLGIEPGTVAFDESLDPVAYVQSVNLNRRHLTGSQRGAAVVACSVWAESGSNQHTGGGEPSAPPQTVRAMAKTADVSPRTIQQNKKAQAAGLGDAVRDGKVSAKRAAEVADLPEAERGEAINHPEPKPLKTKASADVQALEARVEELTDALLESHTFSAALDEADKIIQADDRTAQAWAEVKRLKAEVVNLRARVTGLMNEKNDLIKDAKRWMKKAEGLERKFKALDKDETFAVGA